MRLADALLFKDWDWTGAEREFRRALARGYPRRLAGDEIPIVTRILTLAQTREVFAMRGGPAHGLSVVRERAGRWFDPLVIAACSGLERDLEGWCALDTRDLQTRIPEAEPGGAALLAGPPALDRIALVFAQVVDAKSPFTGAHSQRVTQLSVNIAQQLGWDERAIAELRRAGLLHDLGKAIDHEIEGPHATIGADLARRLGESPAIVHCIEAHHADVEPNTVEAVLVQAADAISASRPGARRETIESYIKRLEKLEELASGHKGVEKVYAMQAGREIRVMVKPEEIKDADAVVMARDIAKQIEDELEYPGQIKVMVIRESRAVDYAK